MILTLLMPNMRTATMDVADGVLVFNGDEFVRAAHLQYAELYIAPVEALSLNYKGLPALQLLTSVRYLARVIGSNPTQVIETDPQLVAVPDPSNGMCVCGITCQGTELQFVTVHTEN